jgi:hypothetical protein
MRFAIEQRYEASPAAVIQAFTDPDLYASYDGLSKVAPPQVVDRHVGGATVALMLQMRFTADLPAAARAVIDPTKLTWVQEERYDLAAENAVVTFHPDHYSDRFSCSGSYEFVTESAASCIRRISGTLSVRMLVVGGQVERALVSGLREHFAEEQPIVQRWLAR